MKKFKIIPQADDSELSFQMTGEMELLPFLLEALSDRGRNSVKSILSRGQVSINEIVSTQHDEQLYKNDVVKIMKNQVAKRKERLIGLDILYEDNHLIVINKSAGLLSIATNKGRELTAHGELMKYVRDKDKQNRIYVVHRLDRDTSGVMMFAKSKSIQQTLQNAWEDIATERTYVALVHGKVKQEKGYVSSWLKENKAFHVYSSQKKNDGLYAMTLYNVIRKNRDYSLLNVELKTGRKNQIRVHMQDLGHPVVGDKRYGGKGNPIKRLGLHAQVLEFMHPVKQEKMRFEVETPSIFYTKVPS
ncbi:MAG TPA: RluA family pseudouridine synthase [Pseudogracilibacillus sp.]|nr:RluA family pseudouridine synthase [Pseudogracilibacillus sp.]